MTELVCESMETTLGHNSRQRIAKRIRWKYRILRGVNVNFFQGSPIYRTCLELFKFVDEIILIIQISF